MSEPSIRPDYESTTIRISDLATIDDVIAGKTFSNCQIFGPAVLAALDGVSIVGCSFDTPSVDDLVIVVEPRLLFGCIGLTNCEFYNCRFSRIGFVGTQDFLEALRTGSA
jgi:hypothetical protein